MKERSEIRGRNDKKGKEKDGKRDKSERKENEGIDGQMKRGNPRRRI